eukprot:Phypoly_transcript_05649.p2 GENE.Phypoly_transcript_05649~~Phypoly_transcript_05649.p2  ORF type:complete len:286 (+),score=33.71 Phypoly_transcript_05649:67-858(+)
MDWASVVNKCVQSCALEKNKQTNKQKKKKEGTPSSKVKNGITTLSASGVIVNTHEGLIVTSGSIILPFLVRDDVTKFPKDNHTLLPGTDLSILLHENGTQIENQNSWVEASLVGVWACEGVGQCEQQLQTEFQYRLEMGWVDIGSIQEGKEKDERAMSMMEFIAVVKLKKPTSNASVMFCNSNQVALGQAIAIIASPFGCISPVAFFNSVSSGVISHSFHGANGSADLILIDARSLPGTEGGGVFDTSGNMVGLVAPRVTYHN